MKFNEEVNPKGEPLTFASVYQNYLASAGLTGGNRPNTTDTTTSDDPNRFKKMVTNLAGSNVPDWATAAPGKRIDAWRAAGSPTGLGAQGVDTQEALMRRIQYPSGVPGGEGNYANAMREQFKVVGPGGTFIDYSGDARARENMMAGREPWEDEGAAETTASRGQNIQTRQTPPPSTPPPPAGSTAPPAPAPPPPPVAQPPDYRDQGEAGQRVARSARTKFSESRKYRDFSVDRREELAEEHKALPDGSFPIVNSKDLHNAVSLHGRAKDPVRAKSHIIRRAKSLGLESELPDTWNESGGQKIGVDDNENKGYISASQEGDMDEEVMPQQFAEMQEQNAFLQEQVNALNTDRRLRMFSDIVLGKGGQNDGTAWLGGPDRHVPMLELLSRSFGEDSDAVRHYIETNTAISQQFAELAERSGLYSEVGLSSPDAVRKVSIAANGTLALPESIANAVRMFKEEHPELDDANAQIKFFSENPDAYAKYNSDHMRRSKEA